MGLEGFGFLLGLEMRSFIWLIRLDWSISKDFAVFVGPGGWGVWNCIRAGHTSRMPQSNITFFAAFQDLEYASHSTRLFQTPYLENQSSKLRQVQER